MKPSEAWITPEYYTGKDAETAGELAKKKRVGESTARAYCKLMAEAGLWKAVTVKREGKRNSETAYIVVKAK